MPESDLSAVPEIMERAAMKPEVFLPDDYRPAEDEPFMNDRQLEYFRRKLINWKAELIEQSAETIDTNIKAASTDLRDALIPERRRDDSAL